MMIALVTMLIAQTPPAADPVPMTLMQIAIKRKAGEADAALAARVADLRQSAPKFTSCDGAVVEAKRIRASVTIRYPVSAAKLPPPLLAILMARPVGHATPAFGSDTSLRVLLRCPADFRDRWMETMKTLKERRDASRRPRET